MEDISGQSVRVAAQVEIGGEPVVVDGQGNGPIDAFVNGLNAAIDRQVRVLDYHEHAIGSGAQARAVAYVEMRIDETRTVFGVGIDANIVSASFKAILSGLHRVTRPHTSESEAQAV